MEILDNTKKYRHVEIVGVCAADVIMVYLCKAEE